MYTFAIPLLVVASLIMPQLLGKVGMDSGDKTESRVGALETDLMVTKSSLMAALKRLEMLEAHLSKSETAADHDDSLFLSLLQTEHTLVRSNADGTRGSGFADVHDNADKILHGTETHEKVVDGSSAPSVGKTPPIIQSNQALAWGVDAGQVNQGEYAVAVGKSAGQTNQEEKAAAVGNLAGQTNQGGYAIAIGHFAGNADQGNSAVAVGGTAAETNQGDYAVAVGPFAGRQGQAANAVAVGPAAGRDSQGKDSVAIGSVAAYENQGAFAIAIGRFAGKSNQGENSVAIGKDVGNGQGANGIIISAEGKTTSTEDGHILLKTPEAELHFDGVDGAGTWTASPLLGSAAVDFSGPETRIAALEAASQGFSGLENRIAALEAMQMRYDASGPGYCSPWGNAGGDLCSDESADPSTCYLINCDRACAEAKCNADSQCKGFTEKSGQFKLKSIIDGVTAKDGFECWRKPASR